MAYYEGIHITEGDRSILRALAEQVYSLSQRPGEQEKKWLWTAHNDLKTHYPVIFIDPENGWGEIIPQASLCCRDDLARAWEMKLRKQVHWGTVLRDDRVISDSFEVPYAYGDTGWGLKVNRVGGGHGGAYKAESVLADYERDFPRLRFPEIQVDYEQSAALLDMAEQVFEGVMPVRRYNAWWWSLGLTWSYIDLRGFEEFLCDFMLEPEYLHKTMDFLCQGTLDRIDRLERDGLLHQNTGNDYVGSGGFGFTEDILPVPPGQKVTTADMWGFVESQETVAVSPDNYAEFILPYHKRLAERFALNCCCCCEPYDTRWQYLKQLPNLRRISCSPWSKRERTEELLGDRYVASIKLSPTPLASMHMDEDLVRSQLREALEASVNCVPELIMKDNNTLGGNPRNASRWVEIAREEIARLHG